MADNATPTCHVGAFATDNTDYLRLTGIDKSDDRLFDVRMSRGAAETLANEIQGLLARPLAEAMGREFMNPTVKQDHHDERGQWWEERKDVARLARQEPTTSAFDLALQTQKLLISIGHMKHDMLREDRNAFTALDTAIGFFLVEEGARLDAQERADV